LELLHSERSIFMGERADNSGTGDYLLHQPSLQVRNREAISRKSKCRKTTRELPTEINVSSWRAADNLKSGNYLLWKCVEKSATCEAFPENWAATQTTWGKPLQQTYLWRAGGEPGTGDRGLRVGFAGEEPMRYSRILAGRKSNLGVALQLPQVSEVQEFYHGKLRAGRSRLSS
jgi:hypothetical protein